MSKKILVVDDEQEIVNLLVLRLEHEGFQIITANDGAAAMEKVKSKLPDLVIMDVAMPPPNGFQVCRMIKDDKTLNHIPVVLLTCKATETDKFWGMESGADAYETKPYNFPSLIKIVKDLLKEPS
jgi:DNA-binding response OmpR family regulator